MTKTLLFVLTAISAFNSAYAATLKVFAHQRYENSDGTTTLIAPRISIDVDVDSAYHPLTPPDGKQLLKNYYPMPYVKTLDAVCKAAGYRYWAYDSHLSGIDYQENYSGAALVIGDNGALPLTTAKNQRIAKRIRCRNQKNNEVVADQANAEKTVEKDNRTILSLPYLTRDGRNWVIDPEAGIYGSYAGSYASSYATAVCKVFGFKKGSNLDSQSLAVIAGGERVEYGVSVNLGGTIDDYSGSKHMNIVTEVSCENRMTNPELTEMRDEHWESCRLPKDGSSALWYRVKNGFNLLNE